MLYFYFFLSFVFSSRRRHTRCALVTGVQTCALPISYDFGLGAGFYVNATVEPFAKNYRMLAYITNELPALIAANFPADMARQSIFGHSMGGHGALTIALRNPVKYRSVSAFEPFS